ncbi:MAG: hypothetical protein GF353_25250 [Candidatus Lokiarchaeota archaeon]|nr:hypothetical protein [Candidatus Lokiarchaeota archaeon]
MDNEQIADVHRYIYGNLSEQIARLKGFTELKDVATHQMIVALLRETEKRLGVAPRLQDAY